jgi:hypothetical protein
MMCQRWSVHSKGDLAIKFFSARAEGGPCFRLSGDACRPSNSGSSCKEHRLGSASQACSKISLADVLSPDERSYCNALPDPVPVWRGCEQGRERGLHWTTYRVVAERFAGGLRCINPRPTLVSALIPKRHIFAVFLERQEHEIVLDPRRLRRLSAAPL